MSVATTHRDYSHDWWTPDRWIRWVSECYLDQVWVDRCPQDWKPGDPDGKGIAHSRNYYNHPGKRGSTRPWWKAASTALSNGADIIWCAFSVEQLRHMDPSPFTLPGWLIMPKKRIGFIWGGPTNDKRVHGEEAKSPANWTVFWSSVRPAEPPEECIIIRTGWTE